MNCEVFLLQEDGSTELDPYNRTSNLFTRKPVKVQQRIDLSNTTTKGFTQKKQLKPSQALNLVVQPTTKISAESQTFTKFMFQKLDQHSITGTVQRAEQRANNFGYQRITKRESGRQLRSAENQQRAKLCQKCGRLVMQSYLGCDYCKRTALDGEVHKRAFFSPSSKTKQYPFYRVDLKRLK